MVDITKGVRMSGILFSRRSSTASTVRSRILRSVFGRTCSTPLECISRKRSTVVTVGLLAISYSPLERTDIGWWNDGDCQVCGVSDEVGNSPLGIRHTLHCNFRG